MNGPDYDHDLVSWLSVDFAPVSSVLPIHTRYPFILDPSLVLPLSLLLITHAVTIILSHVAILFSFILPPDDCVCMKLEVVATT